jgi:hypothetical protein
MQACVRPLQLRLQQLQLRVARAALLLRRTLVLEQLAGCGVRLLPQRRHRAGCRVQLRLWGHPEVVKALLEAGADTGAWMGIVITASDASRARPCCSARAASSCSDATCRVQTQPTSAPSA